MPVDANRSARDASAVRRESRLSWRPRLATTAASADGARRPNQALGVPGMT